MDICNKWKGMSPETKIAIVALFKNADIDIEEEIFAASRNKISDPIWIRLGDAARIANVSPYTVRRWCADRLIAWRKLNNARCGRVLVSRASLTGFIDNCKGREA